MGNSVTSNYPAFNNSWSSTLERNQKNANKNDKTSPPSVNAENSRIFFLLYLIHRTWNVVIETVDLKSKKTRHLSQSKSSNSDDSSRYCYYYDEFDKNNRNDEDDSFYDDSQSCSVCNCCNCCNDEKRNPLYGRTGLRLSFCESDLSYCFGYEMAPSAGKSPPSTQINSMKMSTEIAIGLNLYQKENQRPPVYNAEDYINSLKKYAHRPNAHKTVYSESSALNDLNIENRSSTLPSKYNAEYKSPIPTPPEPSCEMALRQFGSITDLLSKLRSDLRASFPSFVQEFVASPLDGVSLLLEVLRAIQLSPTINMSSGTIIGQQNSMPRNSQTYQRRALLDELACLQCLSLCSTRSPEAGARLATTPVGLLPLAASATGQGIRSRILALQLLTTACDKSSFVHGSQECLQHGHTSVSEALSTLRLRCGEPVRFRLLVGMLSSGGGSGELQAFGLKFINTFLESAENAQNKLYLQAELCQAGFEPLTLTKTISSSSPWLEKIRLEIKHFEKSKVDVDRLMSQARESEIIKSKMVILERRVQILQEEKTVLTSMERRLQERCAELQREVFRLQCASKQNGYENSGDKRPIALPRQVQQIHSKRGSSDQDDEGISSSETGQSITPEPILGLQQPQRLNILQQQKDEDATIDDVIEELTNIVNDAEKEISNLKNNPNHIEKDIVPVNILPQPPKKSKSLLHFLSNGSDCGDGSDYDYSFIRNNNKNSFFEEIIYDENEPSKYIIDEIALEEENATTKLDSTNRELLDVIMDARDKDANRINVFSNQQQQQQQQRPSTCNDDDRVKCKTNLKLQHKFNGVFFMTEMNTPQKYPKPDIAAALEARRVSKTIDKLESYGNSTGIESLVDIIMTPADNSKILVNRQFGSVVPGSSAKGKNIFTSLESHSKLSDLPSGLY